MCEDCVSGKGILREMKLKLEGSRSWHMMCVARRLDVIFKHLRGSLMISYAIGGISTEMHFKVSTERSWLLI